MTSAFVYLFPLIIGRKELLSAAPPLSMPAEDEDGAGSNKWIE